MDLPHGYKCIKDDCIYYAIYLGDERPLYCDFHHPNPDAIKKPTFKGYKHRICIEPTCQERKKRASFNYEIGMKQIFCNNHKQPDMINVASKKCIECKKNDARYGYKKDYPKATLCIECREKKTDKNDIVSSYETLCNPPHCWTHACFGYNRKDKKEWRCKKHKKDDMTDVKNIHLLCQFASGCQHQANYNFIDQTKAIFCKAHKDIGMVDVTHPKCEHERCRLRPSYNYETEISGRFCYTHKLDDMVDVLSKKCIQCNKVPIYNFPQYSYPVCCSDHTEPNMIDVRHMICEMLDCNTQATYGYLGNVVQRCATHKLVGMLRQPRRRCQDQNCCEYACYGYDTTYPLYCELHKKFDNINLVEQKCKSCELTYILNLDGLCMYCESIHKQIVMKKQHIIKMWLENNNYRYILYDKPIDHGICGVRNRPDFLFESINGSLMIVLEVDENMHKNSNYTPECDTIRMFNISQILGQPTIFIRFNPDSYMKDGVRIINDDPRYRHSVLKQWLDYCISISVEKLYHIGYCSAIYLFYNDFDVDNINFRTITQFDGND